MRKILIIDDEQSICEIMKEILTDEGFETYTAMTEEKAFELVRDIDFDIIFLDIWLPKMSGMEILKIFKTRNNFEKPIIMISGHANIDLAVKAVEYGAYDFLEKPLTLEKISTVLKNANETLDAEENTTTNKGTNSSLEKMKLDFEKQCIKNALEANSTLKDAAEFLQINEQELKALIKEHNIKID
ncbi:MAG: response regulator [Spirochaetales bacterium]|nr:response regulator [Spirochaetales bacterium]